MAQATQASERARPATDEELQELVASSDTGARQPRNPMAMRVLILAALMWSLFQLWYASPLPFMTGILIVNDAQARSVHLAFAIFLAFLAFPALRRSPRDRIPVQDWVLAIVGAFCASYRFWFYDDLAERPGLPTELDIYVSLIGLILLLEATRRSLGPPLMTVAIVFMLYVFFGNAGWIPDVIRYQGASLNRAMDQYWLSDQGVFGIAIGVSTKFVFLFVLFGALLEKAGAGNYFIKTAFSLLGHLRGGPAKAAVVASGMTGLISGSSIANTVTTGTFTIPLMRRVGFTAEKAGAVEVASSVNGQIMPPVMGAAAFLMVEYVGIPYIEVIKHAFLPAIISYIALLYIVHLEALKQGMQGLPKPHTRPWYASLITGGIIIASVVILAGLVYFGIGWLRDGVLGLLGFPEIAVAARRMGGFDPVMLTAAYEPLAATAGQGFWASAEHYFDHASLMATVERLDSVRQPLLAETMASWGWLAGGFGIPVLSAGLGPTSIWIIVLGVGLAYLALLWFAARYPELSLDDPNAPMIALPESGPTVKSGLHYLLPIVVLVWCLMVERLSPGLSAFWATTFMIVIMLTQRPLFVFFRGADRGLAGIFATLRDGVVNLALWLANNIVMVAGVALLIGFYAPLHAWLTGGFVNLFYAAEAADLFAEGVAAQADGLVEVLAFQDYHRFLDSHAAAPSLLIIVAAAALVFCRRWLQLVRLPYRHNGSAYATAVVRGRDELFDALITGARNMIGIGVATATAGIIVGTVSLTGIGLVMSAFVEFLSGGNLLLMLFLVAILSLILGMGLPTTANYIVVSALMAPVIVTVGADAGLIVPLIAVHLFVFYFGIMADVTPPVGLASFAAAAVSGGDPIRTGFTAFFYSLRTVALPFMFIFNTELILYDIQDAGHLLMTVAAATVAMLVFAAGTQGYFLVRCRWYEIVALLLVAFSLFRPGFWMDMIYPPDASATGDQIFEIAELQPPGTPLTVVFRGEFAGQVDDVTIVLDVGEGDTGEQRLQGSGLSLMTEAESVIVGMTPFSGPGAGTSIAFGYEVATVTYPLETPAKEWMYLPALLLLGGVVGLQRMRREPAPPARQSAPQGT